MAIFAVVHQLLIIRLLAPQALWHREPSGLMRKRTTARSRCCTAYICILERRAQLWALASQHPSEVTSGYDMAKSWSASIVGQVRIRTVNSRCIRPVNQPSATSPLALLSHIPRSANPTRPTTARKRCRRGSEPIVYGRRLCNFAAEGKVAESEESRSVRAQTLQHPINRPKRRVAATWPSRGQPPAWGKHVRVRSIPDVSGQ